MNYDYIIVGAGSAGCVLANRLSESGEHSVALIEAGGKGRHPHIHIPGAYPKIHRSSFDWQFWSEPQKQLNNRKIYLPRGKVLGGCSSTNAMAYVRGNREDYNDWAKGGCTGWSYDDVLPYFLKSEHNEQIEKLDQGYHAQGGPLHVSFAKYFESPYAQAFIDSGKAIGFPSNDYNGATQNTITRFQYNIKNGLRHSGAAAFIKPVLKRNNLTVFTNTRVTSINLKNDKANGVSVIGKNGSHQVISASKEVILSAGAFQSPQLLMLSGIGDPDKLNHHGIEIKKELPGVGQNLQDHLFYFISAHTKTKEGLNHHATAWNQIKDTISFAISKKGNPLTCSPLEAVAFFNSHDIHSRVDTQFHFCPFQVNDMKGLDIYNFKQIPLNEDGFLIGPSLLRPASRGYVSLRSSSPTDAPIIQPNFLEKEEDMALLVRSGRKALELLQQEPIAKHIKALPGPTPTISDEELIAYIRRSVETIYHPVGTCKMGIDETSVVDTQLRVNDIDGLRVIDASIMPTIVSGNTNAPTYMIGEKGADLVLTS